MASEKFGIYRLAYPGDYYLSSILVRSIQQVSPDIPIMIIPGEGFDLNDHPFDVPVMPIPLGFWATGKSYYDLHRCVATSIVKVHSWSDVQRRGKGQLSGLGVTLQTAIAGHASIAHASVFRNRYGRSYVK
jgi:hypothetical protein